MEHFAILVQIVSVQFATFSSQCQLLSFTVWVLAGSTVVACLRGGGVAVDGHRQGTPAHPE